MQVGDELLATGQGDCDAPDLCMRFAADGPDRARRAGADPRELELRADGERQSVPHAFRPRSGGLGCATRLRPPPIRSTFTKVTGTRSRRSPAST